MKEIKISVLTPTFNRSNLLERLYRCLLNQSYTNFEWIIVNDGSNDDTDIRVNKWISENKINIKYVSKENGGKPSAHNAGIDAAESTLTIICDDDDYPVSKCLQTVAEYWDKYKEEGVGGMIAYRGSDKETPLLGYTFPNGFIYGYLKDVFLGQKLFDTVQIYKTDLLKNNLFPTVKNEKFIPEIWLWRRIDKSYKLIVIREVLEICEYMSDGLTKTNRQNMWNNPNGYAYYFFQKADIMDGFSRIKYLGIGRALADSQIKKDSLSFFTFLEIVTSFPIYIAVKFLRIIKRREN